MYTVSGRAMDYKVDLVTTVFTIARRWWFLCPLTVGNGKAADPRCKASSTAGRLLCLPHDRIDRLGLEPARQQVEPVIANVLEPELVR